jgi:hypothetical protein
LAGSTRHIDLADAPSLVLLIRDDDPLRYERAAVRWLSRYAAEDHELGSLTRASWSTCSQLYGRHDRVAKLRLERFLRARIRGGG